VSPGVGVTLVGPQEELCGPGGYILRGFNSLPGREAKYGFLGFVTTNKCVKAKGNPRVCHHELKKNACIPGIPAISFNKKFTLKQANKQRVQRAQGRKRTKERQSE